MVASMAVPRDTGESGVWQYHSRSDVHSNVSCWGVLFDLLQASSVLREHVSDGKVVFGMRHPLKDYGQNKEKKLDLVLCTPGSEAERKKRSPFSFAELAVHWNVVLTPDQKGRLEALPPLVEAPVGAVLVALEAKACMTKHSGSAPRLYDELNSSHQIVHGASNNALSIGLVTINAAEEFISFDSNKFTDPAMRTKVSKHKMPLALQKALDTVEALPRRTSSSRSGYDGLGIVVVKFRNDLGPVEIMSAKPAPQPGDIFHYDAMLNRMANEYNATFSKL